MPNIKIIHAKGVELLNEREKQLVNRLLNEYYGKIHRQLKNEVSFEVHIKTYQKEGKAKKFSINVRAVFGRAVFEANADDWDLARCVHKVMNKIMNEIEHKFHVSDQGRKGR